MTSSQHKFLPATRILLECLGDTIDAFSMASLKRQLSAATALLAENPPIDVAVLGQFKAGKSSLLNSLIERDVLPVGAIPVTTVVTRLQYGATERALIRHFDGHVTAAPLSSVGDYTSEAKNPGNGKNVEIVDIELPSLMRLPGLRLVDTPGLGSVFKYHQSTSANWLPSVGTALLAVSSDRPLSENDLNLIRELSAYTPNIVLLLTKADLLSEAQQKEVIVFFSETLKRELRRTLPVYLYSIKDQTGQYRKVIEEDICQTLCANRNEEFLRILNHKTRSLAASCMGYLRIALQASHTADQNRANLRSRILDEKVNEGLMREELGIMAREHQRRTRPLIENYLAPFLSPLTKTVREKLERELPSWSGNLWKLSRRYESWVSETLSEEMRRISKTEQRHFLGTLQKAHAGFSRSLEAFRKSLSDNIENVLGTKLKPVEWKIDVVEPDSPDISFTKTFDIHLDLIWFLIPMFLFRKVFERHFLQGLPKEVEINLSRLAFQWEKSINIAIDTMFRQAVSYVSEELATVEAQITRTRGQTENIKQAVLRIENMINSSPA
ncbi:MAG: dynamin family protein [Smithellaceae bacterium]|nr:dynamin family protein [Smithellaceae bacterium]